MKKSFVLPVILVLFLSCNRSAGPAEISKQFIRSLYLLDYKGASALATSDTKEIINRKGVLPIEQSPEQRSKGFGAAQFQLDALTENINGNSAIVENDAVRVSLIRENEGWRILASEPLIDGIINRAEKIEALQIKWGLLQKAFDERTLAAKEYLEYKARHGSVSANGQALLEAIANTSLGNNYTKAQMIQYLQRQEEISTLIDKAIEPSFTAGADLSVNLILRITEGERNIQAAKTEYNKVVRDVKSGLYPPVQEKAAQVSN